MKKAYFLIAILAAPIFSSNLFAQDNHDYTNQSFHHDLNIINQIDILVGEGKTLLTQLYNNEELLKPSLNIQDAWINETKYAPWREKLAVLSGGIRLAKSWITNWMYGEDEGEKTRKLYLTKITTMMWGIFGQSVNKNEGFVRGSYKIIDPEFKLYNFLLGYVKLATGVDDPKTLPYGLTTSNHAYRRSPRLKGSSHYKLECKNDEQFGIDIRRESYETTLKILPSSKTHILFGRLTIPGSNLPITFVKFEEVGMGGLGEFFDHSLNFGASGHNLTDADRREKDIHEDVKFAFGEYCKYLSSGVTQEKILNIDNMTLVEKIKKSGTVYEMLQFLHENFNAHEDFNGMIEAFYGVLEANGYESQVADIRNGNEVILDHHCFIHDNVVNDENINVLVELLNEDNLKNSNNQPTLIENQNDSESIIIVNELVGDIKKKDLHAKTQIVIDEENFDPNDPDHIEIIHEISRKKFGKMDIASLKHAQRMTKGRLKNNKSASYALDVIHLQYINQYIEQLKS